VGALSQPDPDYGATLRGGAWLVRDHLQPIAELGWARSGAGDLNMDGVRFGAGLAAGTSVANARLWLGAGVLPRAMWVRASDRSAPSTWSSSTELAAVGQVRLRRIMLGLRVGVDLTLPPIVSQGVQDRLRWGPARFVVGLEVGPAFWGRIR
jgi:hypothetical protein